MQGRYWLKRMVGGIPHWAVVAVRVEAAPRDEVVVSGEAFAWRRDRYQPGAASGGPVDRELGAAAMKGVRHVLGRVGGPARQVTVIEIRDSPVDTVPGDVAFAAAMATCLALDVTLDPQPSLHGAAPGGG